MYWTMVESESREVCCSIRKVVMSSARGVPRMELSKIGSSAFEALSVYIWLQSVSLVYDIVVGEVRDSTDCDQVA